MKVEKVRDEKLKDLRIKTIDQKIVEAFGFRLFLEDKNDEVFLKKLSELLLQINFLMNQEQQKWERDVKQVEEIHKNVDVHFGKWKLSKYYKYITGFYGSFLLKVFQKELRAIELRLRELLEKSALSKDEFQEAKECWTHVMMQIACLTRLQESGDLSNIQVSEQDSMEIENQFNKRFRDFYGIFY